LDSTGGSSFTSDLEPNSPFFKTNDAMKKNMGSVDKTFRLLVAIALVAFYFLGVVEGVLGTVALVVAGVFMLTSVISFCPLYTLFGINTCKTKSA
jgi:hypothetical protein